MAYEVVRNGGKLILSARRADALERVRTRCFEINPKLTAADILLLPLDITQFSLHQACFDAALAHFGHVSWF